VLLCHPSTLAQRSPRSVVGCILLLLRSYALSAIWLLSKTTITGIYLTSFHMIAAKIDLEPFVNSLTRCSTAPAQIFRTSFILPTNMILRILLEGSWSLLSSLQYVYLSTFPSSLITPQVHRHLYTGPQSALTTDPTRSKPGQAVLHGLQRPNPRTIAYTAVHVRLLT
jgi:hypothetical protein